jgi:hypothetical protein
MLIDRLRDLYAFNPATGQFTNRFFRAANAQAGQVAGCVNTRLEGERQHYKQFRRSA